MKCYLEVFHRQPKFFLGIFYCPPANFLLENENYNWKLKNTIKFIDTPLLWNNCNFCRWHENVIRKFERRIPSNIYLFKVNYRNTRKRCEIVQRCSKLTIKTPERHFTPFSSVPIVNFKHLNVNLISQKKKVIQYTRLLSKSG